MLAGMARCAVPAASSGLNECSMTRESPSCCAAERSAPSLPRWCYQTIYELALVYLFTDARQPNSEITKHTTLIASKSTR